MRKFLILLVMVAFSGYVQAVESFDLQNFINRQISAGEKTIIVPPGDYRVIPQNRVHLKLSRLTDVTLIMDGVEMVCTETTQAVGIENCTNLTIRGLTIDYDPLPFTQGSIIEISPDRKSHIIQVDKGYPDASLAQVSKHAVFSSDGMLKYGNYYQFKLETLAGNRLKISGLEHTKDGGEQVGDQVVVGARYAPGGFSPHAVFCTGSKSTVLENITLYASPMFGFFETHCDGSVYRNCRIDRRSPETDLAKRAPRLRSLNADAYHSKFARKGPQLLNCTAQWQGDDCVNICGAYHLVTEVDGDTLRVLAKQDMDIESGDPVELITVDGQRVSDAKVLSVTSLGSVSGEEKERLGGLKLLTHTRGFLTKAYAIKLDRSVDLPFGSVIGSMNRMGNGFAIKNCTFGNNRSRGILVKASNGEISGNRIEKCFMQAIKIAPEYQWLESGASCNLVISNNIVVDSGMEAVQVHAFGEYPVHENIQISGNTIRSDFIPAIYIGGLAGGVVQNNLVERADGSKSDATIVLEHCTHVTVQNELKDR